MSKQLHTLILALNILFATSLTATNYYCNPISGNMNNNGTSEASAWGSLKDLFGSYKRNQLVEGDVVYLMNGMHERAYIAMTNTGYITIKALEGHSPKLSGVQFGTASYWAFDGLIFTADGTGGSFATAFINTGTTTTHIKVTNSTFYMEEDSSSWTYDDWYNKTQKRTYFPIRIRGDHFIFNSNHIKNVYFGLLTEGSNIEIKNNIIENFGADAIQMQNCSNVHIEGNIIQNAYLENYGGNVGGHPSNHDDAIQILGLTSSDLDNIVIIRNKVYSFNKPITQDMIDNNLVGYQMQGIFLTNGRITNGLFENNLVVIDTYHGITLNSSQNTRLQNNTVVRTPTDYNPQSIRPWVSFYDGGGTHSGGTLRNNIAYELQGVSGVVSENNITVSNSVVDNYFSDYSGFDFTLNSSSPAIDAGVNSDLAEIDLAGNNRLHGSFVDVGAYEYGSTLSLPVNTTSNISVYPTVIVDDFITIEVNKSLVGKIVDLKLYTINGQVVFDKKIEINQLKNIIEIGEVNNFNSNVFLLKVSNLEISQMFKLLK